VSTFTDKLVGPKIRGTRGITDDISNKVRNRILFWCTVVASAVTVINVLYNWIY